MTTGDALLAAICAAPDDDLPRLVYADWLDENGEPERAEFIRVQVEIAKQKHPGHPQTKKLRKRESQLWHRGQQKQFLGAGGFNKVTTPVLSQMIDGSGWRCSATVRRGFVECVTVPTCETWIGGECRRCDGTGMEYVLGRDGRRLGGGMGTWSGPTRGGWPIRECPACSCSGTTPGIGGEVVRRHPVREVRVADREPDVNQQYTGTIASWQSHDPARPSWVPYPLLQILYAEDDTGPHADGRNAIYFPTRDAAVAALSRALIAAVRPVTRTR